MLHNIATAPADDYYYTLPLEINGRTTEALVDSGNTWRTVISPAMCRRLGYKLDQLLPVPGAERVGTAKAGTTIKVLGQLPKPISLRLGSHPTIFKLTPAVLEGLSTPVNLSGRFLQKHNIDQLHSKRALRVQGRLVPLRAPAADCPAAAGDSVLYIDKTETIPPWSIQHVQLRAPAVVGGTAAKGAGLIRGEEQFEDKSDLHPWRNAVGYCNADGRLMAGLMNTTDKPIQVPAGMRYGMFQPADLPSPAARMLQQLQADDSPKHELSLEKRCKIITERIDLHKSTAINTKADKDKATLLLADHFDVFSWDGESGSTDLLEHEIELLPNAKPVNHKYKPPNPAIEGDLRKQLDAWLRDDVIEKTRSAWSSRLVAVPKKDGTIRWAVDYRTELTHSQIIKCKSK